MKTVRASASLARTRSSKYASRRSFTSIGRRKAASNYTMPALSPTMTEGNIAKWRVNEGDSYSAGDVILEIETDKATMDVEAQDDGILVKIFAPDDSKAVKVGARIAVMAEPGDDVNKLELPADESAKKADSAQEQEQKEEKKSKPEPKQESESQQAKPEPSLAKDQRKAEASSSSQSSKKGTKQKYPLYPSVQHLLHENGLADTTADEIPASGPNGRLLKGDVLAYLGRIDKNYPSEASARLAKLSHLDLSNIQLAEPKKQPSAAAAVKEEAALQEPAEIDLALPISLNAVLETQQRVEKLLNTSIPLSVFIARASELANEGLPHPKGRKVSSDELFNAVLGLPPPIKATSRGTFVPQMSTIDLTQATSQSRKAKQHDIYDILTGSVPARSSGPSLAVPAIPAMQQDLFSVTARPEDQQRAAIYLERLKDILEKDPGRLVV